MKIVEGSILHKLARSGGWSDRVYDRKLDRNVPNTNSCQFIRNVCYGTAFWVAGIAVVLALLGAIIQAIYLHPREALQMFLYIVGTVVGLIALSAGLLYSQQKYKEVKENRKEAIENGAELTFTETAYKAWKDKFCPKLEVVRED